MELIVSNITLMEDCRLLAALAKRLGANPVLVPTRKLKGHYVSKTQVLATLAEIK